MYGSGYRLGVDFGSSNTVAVMAWPDGGVKPLLFDGSEILASAVALDPAGALVVGRDAVHAARLNPAMLEPNPKRAVDEGVMLLGEVEVPVVDLFAAVMGRVATEARRVAAGPITALTLTHPSGWGPRRRAILAQAATQVGLPQPALIPEPVAAAQYLTDATPTAVPQGGCLVIYDFGAGTFDATVVRRDGARFAVLSGLGLTDVGGLDIDMAIVAHLGAVFAVRDAARWARLTKPVTVEDRRGARWLLEDVRNGKEMLSRTASTLVTIPLFDETVTIGREQFELIARPLLDRTVDLTVAALRQGGIDRSRLAGVLLVGGSSRIPLAATLLHRALGIAPTVVERPEMVVAEGSLRVPLPTVPALPVTSLPPAPRVSAARVPPPAPPFGPPPVTARSGRATVIIVACIASLVLVGAVIVIVAIALNQSERDGETGDFPVGTCVKQDGIMPRAADCGDPDAFKVAKRVSRPEDCPDTSESYILITTTGGQREVLCLNPVDR